MGPGGLRVVSAWVWVFVLIVFVFAAVRIMTDAGNILSGTMPGPGEFEHRYAKHPWLAYAHILPGVVYLALAPLQLWRGFRMRHLRWHRRIGRVALASGTMAGVFAIAFGLFLSFGRALEASASVLFGAYFVTALALAFRSIRGGDAHQHRRWMIRAFALGLAVGTIRIWVGLFQGFGLLGFRASFGVAFWLGFAMHAMTAELWLRWRPSPGYPYTSASTATAANNAPR